MHLAAGGCGSPPAGIGGSCGAAAASSTYFFDQGELMASAGLSGSGLNRCSSGAYGCSG